MVYKIPIEKHVVDKEEEESYKLMSSVRVDKRITHYTCLCNYFMIFVSDKEINCKKNPMLDAFKAINTIQKFKELDIPLTAYSTMETKTCENISDIKADNKSTLAFEIDLQNIKRIAKKFGMDSN